MLQRYTNCLSYFNGGLLSENATVTIKRDSKAQQVDTIAKGFAGVSPGAAMMTVDLTNAAPSKDFELNPGPFISRLEIVELTFFAAGRTLTTKANVISDNFSAAVNTESKLEFTAWCEFADWT